MKFQLSSWANKLDSHYPHNALVSSRGTAVPRDDVIRFVRLWLTEGIPFAFKDRPMLYESMREWVGDQLFADARDVSMVGSGRIGISLAPDRFGAAFSAASDLDLFVISPELFNFLHDEFRFWMDEWDAGRIRADDRSKRFWSTNKIELPGTIARGFIDPYKIEALDQNDKTRRCRRIQGDLKKRFAETTHAPTFSKASIRVYQDWNSAISQITTNVLEVFRSRP